MLSRLAILLGSGTEGIESTLRGDSGDSGFRGDLLEYISAGVCYLQVVEATVEMVHYCVGKVLSQTRKSDVISEYTKPYEESPSHDSNLRSLRGRTKAGR